MEIVYQPIIQIRNMYWAELVFSAEFLSTFLLFFLLLDLLYTIAEFGFCYHNGDRSGAANIQCSQNYPQFMSTAHYWPAATARISSATCLVNKSTKPAIQKIHCCRKCGQKITFNVKSKMLSIFIPSLERVRYDNHGMSNAPNHQLNNSYLYDDDGSNYIANAASQRRGTVKENAKIKHNVGQLTRFTRSRKQYGKYLIIGE